MQVLEFWRLDAEAIIEGLALGIELFGPYADWLWLMPAVWATTAISLWLYTSWRQRRADRAYLDYASHNLHLLRRIAKQRAEEVTYFGRYDRP